MKGLILAAAICLPSILFSQKNDTSVIETIISSDFTFIRQVPNKDSIGILANKGDTVKLSFLTEGPDYGLTLFWRLSTGGYIKDESLVQTAEMVAYKKKAMLIINKRIDKQFKILDSLNVIKAKKENIEIAKLSKIFGEQNGILVYYNMVWVGMTDRMAEYSIGLPDRINRTTYSWGIEEQWVYNRQIHSFGTPLYLYFKDSRLTAYQESK